MDLIVFDMLECNIILGIDFLSQYEVEINNKKKKVQFHLDDNEEFTFGESRVLNIMVSSVKAKTNVE